MLTKKSESLHPIHYIEIADARYRCSIGSAGVVTDKKEGDGGTPLGSFQVRRIYYRPDRIDPAELKTDIAQFPLTENDGWCDDVDSPEYNTLVKLPFQSSHEVLWREDNLYDIIGVLAYNDDPAQKGKGSAIFLHIAREGYSPTAGCIALSSEDLKSFISRLSINDEIQTNLSGNCEVISASTAE